MDILIDKLKDVKCGNCNLFERDKAYEPEGRCKKDGEYTREHRVCHKLLTDADRREAKIRRNG